MPISGFLYWFSIILYLSSFKGNDDTSFIRRFKTRNDMFMFLKEYQSKIIKIYDFSSTENPFLMID